MNIGKLSLYYAIFENVENDLMRLINTYDCRKFPDSFNQILRYNGKTNEQFTRLMLNVAESVCKTNSKTMKLRAYVWKSDNINRELNSGVGCSRS